MITSDKDVVADVSRALAGRLGSDRFEVWFNEGKCLTVEEDTLVVSAGSQFKLDRLRKYFRQPIEQAWRELAGQQAEVNFRVCQLEEPAPPALTPVVATQADAGQSADESNQAHKGRRKFATLSTFVVGDANRLAFTSCEMAAASPGQLSPLFLFGPTGCGKTHLLEGVWSEARRRRNGRIVYLSAEQFTTYFLEALHGQGLPSFRRKYRGVDLLIIDDVQFFAGKKATLTELLHTMDTLLREGRQLILAADQHPTRLTELGSALTARFTSGVICPIQLAELPTRLGIARQLATRLKIEVPSNVLEYVAAHLPPDGRVINGALNCLLLTSRAMNQPITISLAEQALADLIRTNQASVQLADIERAVCDVLGIDGKSLQSQRKSKAVSHPRMLAMWLARKYTPAALSEIGTYFGRRSHTTVISAHKRVTRWMSDDAPLSIDGRTWKVSQAISEIEGQLRTG